MPDIVDAEAVRFANERVRLLANVLLEAYYMSKSVLNEWYANQLSAKLTGKDVVQDGAESDGRHPVTGDSATNVIVRAAELVADMEAGGNAKLNTILQVSSRQAVRLD